MVDVRAAIEKLYIGTLTVTELRSVTDEKTKLTDQEPVVTLTGQPCRLSTESSSAASVSDHVTKVSQSLKVFLSPDVQVPPGSKLTITQNGVTIDYALSGPPAIYATHQEVPVELFREYA